MIKQLSGSVITETLKDQRSKLHDTAVDQRILLGWKGLVESRASLVRQNFPTTEQLCEFVEKYKRIQSLYKHG